jgi:hypothetical protein
MPTLAQVDLSFLHDLLSELTRRQGACLGVNAGIGRPGVVEVGIPSPS